MRPAHFGWQSLGISGRRESSFTPFITEKSVRPSYGRRPVHNSHIVMPKEKTSTFSVALLSLFSYSSGAILSGKNEPQMEILSRLIIYIFENTPTATTTYCFWSCNRRVSIWVHRSWKNRHPKEILVSGCISDRYCYSGMGPRTMVFIQSQYNKRLPAEVASRYSETVGWKSL